ncbi:MAG: S9 family peptidase [Anaerolineae bacterium]
MPQPEVAPYGTWASPITSDLIVAKSIRLGNAILDGDDVYWLEGRPSEGGRNVLVKRTPDGEVTDVIPPPFNARTRVHEYGGGAVIVRHGTVYFSNYRDQRMYRVGSAGAVPEQLTPPTPIRYADGVIDGTRRRIICVIEDHTESALKANSGEPVNAIGSVSLEDGAVQRLVDGSDFYATPRLRPDGQQLAWLNWDHPNMPWDGTELWIADLDDAGRPCNARRVAGGPTESVFQPVWSPDGVLTFVSDRSGWWNIYRCEDDDIKALTPMAAEFGQPQWNFGLSTYAYVSPDRIVCTYTRAGADQLAFLDVHTRELSPIDTPYTSLRGIAADENRVFFNGGAPTRPSALVVIDIATEELRIFRRSADLDLDPGYLSVPQSLEFPTEDGRTAYGLFYRPHNRDFVAPAGEKPPLLVLSHGGPTSATSSSLSLRIQYWTSRGFAVLDVNYGGSTGYGRPYREYLKGRWGVVDVDDCANGARFLVDRGLVDGERLAIRGSSAGGYTTLRALTFRDVFRAGASYYGVSDLEALAREIHKFESRYLDGLVGPYPESRDTYVERSPIHHLDRLHCPIIFFQGLEDEVVPPNQAELMVTALREEGFPVAYLAFEGEQHGFRRDKNIKRALDAELYFYGKIFGFEPADEIEPVDIDNLESVADRPRS